MTVVGSIERVGSLSPREFQREFAFPERPVILSGAIEKWPARRRWVPDWLERRFGAARVRCKVSESHRHPDFALEDPRRIAPTREVSFSELMQRLGGPEGARWLLTGDEEPLLRVRSGQRQVHPVLGPLLEDVETPPLFDADRLYTVWVWFSAAGARTWLHYDNNGCHNLNAQIRGSKRVWLYPPTALDCFYPFGLDAQIPAHGCSQVDAERPDWVRFPRFAQARALEGEVQEGDLLFIPAFWFHSFLHVGFFNANVNFWWRPEALRLHPVSERWLWLKQLATALTGVPSAGAGPDRAALETLPAEARALVEKIDAQLLAPRELG